MTEPSERDRQIADEAVTKGPVNFRKWLYQVVADARAEGRREALLDAATALHWLPTPQVGQHPECIVLAMIEREADISETPLRALADRPAPAAPQSGATLAIDFATAEEADEAFAWLEQNMPSPQTGTLSMRTCAPAAPPEASCQQGEPCRDPDACPDPSGCGVVAAPPEPSETEWLRRLLRWCRPRLKHPSYQSWLDKYLAAGPSDAPKDEPLIMKRGAPEPSEAEVEAALKAWFSIPGNPTARKAMPAALIAAAKVRAR